MFNISVYSFQKPKRMKNISFKNKTENRYKLHLRKLIKLHCLVNLTY